MKTVKLFSLLSIIVSILVTTSCDPDPKPVNEEELITTVTYTLTPSDGSSPVILKFKDLDGDGGAIPVITNGTLKQNTTYNGILTLSNESVSPAEDITQEVNEEGQDHQFFFSSSLAGITVSYNDKDADNRPIGLSTVLKTGGSEIGSLKVTLRHLPNKTAANVASGDITNAGGETDVEVSYIIDVK
jgi:hypothetical protein